MSTESSKSAARYYWAGGTMPPMNRSYIERHADQELFEAIKAGDFCYVLTSRQMGKSSLVSRAAGSLRSAGYHFGFIDLSGLGKNLTAVQWFDGMLERIGDDFDIEDEVDEFRKANSNLGPQQMWLEVIRRVLLREITGRVVIVIDEIDYVRSIENFSTDELFTGIREIYNRRSRDPELERLSFCLMGVASPADLIENKDITPFNIGHRIELRDFTSAESLALADGLTRLPQDKAQQIVSRVYYWTGGQPYLTQKICAMAAADESLSEPAHVDRIVAENFLSLRARETDDNLTAIRDRIDKERTLQPEFTIKLLGIYRRVLKGGRVEDSEVLPEVSALKLTGLVRGEKGWLMVKNPIYRENFNALWIADRMPKDWVRMAALWGRAAAILLLIVCPVVAVWALSQRSKADLARVKAEVILEETVKAKEAADKSRAEATTASLRAKQEAEEATRKTVLATDAQRKAELDKIAAEEEQRKASAAMAQLYKAQTTNFWSDGKRIVEAMFFRKAMEDMVTLPKGAKEELKAASSELLAEDRPASDDPKAQAAPVTNEPDRELKSHVEPAGAFKLAGEMPVTDIVPWWHQPGFLVLQQMEDDPSLRQMFAWDLSSRPNPVVEPTLSLNFPLTLDDFSPETQTTKFARTLDSSKDGRRLLVVDVTGTLHVWELQPTLSSLVIKTPRKLAAAAFLPDGKKIIAAVIDGPVISIELATGIESDPILPPSGEWTALALSPSGDRCLAGLADGTVLMAGTGAEKALPVQWRHEGRISALAFLPDGKNCAVATTREFDSGRESGTVELRETAVGKTASAACQMKEGIESMAVSPNGTIAVGGRLGNVCLLDASTLRETARIVVKDSDAEVSWNSRINVGFSADGGRLVASTCFGDVGVWSADGQEKVARIADLSLGRNAVLILPDGRVANAGMVEYKGGYRGDVALFEVDPVEEELRYLTLDPESLESSDDVAIPRLTSIGFTAAGFCPSKGIVALSVANKTKSSDDLPILSHVSVGYARGFEELRDWMDGISNFQRHDPGRELRLTPASFSKPKAPGSRAAASKNSRSSGDGNDPSRAETEEKTTNEAPCSLALSKDGKCLAAGFPNGDVAVLDIKIPDPLDSTHSGQAASTLRWRKSLFKNAVKTLSFGSHGLLLLAGNEKNFVTYKAATGVQESSDGFSGPVVMGPDDLTHLVTKDGGNDGMLLRMDHGSYSLNFAHSFRSSFPPVAFAFSPEGSWHAAGLRNGSIRLGREDGVVETIPAFSEKSAQADAVAFSPDGRFLVAADQHGWLRVWKFFPAPVPIIRPGESLENAKSRWSVEVSDALAVVVAAREDNSWRDMRADGAAARDIVESCNILGQATEWYGDGSGPVRREDIDALLARAGGAQGKLEKCGVGCQHLLPLEKFKTLLAAKPASMDENQAVFEGMEALPSPLRWLLLSTRIKSLALPDPQARDLWLKYADVLQDRLLMNNDSNFKRETLSQPWQAVFDEGVLAIKTAVGKGAREFRQGSYFYDSPQMADVKAQVKKLEEKSARLSAAYDKIKDEQNESAKKELRIAYLKAYDEAVRNGHEPDFYEASKAQVQARNLQDYERAAPYLELTASLAGDASQRAYVEISRSYLAEERGKPAEALEHMRKATAIPARQDESWERRFQLEDKAASLSGNQTDLQGCIADLEKAAGDKKLEETWRTIFLKVAKHFNKFGHARETRAFAEEVFKAHPADLKLYKAFWDGISTPDEEYRLWALTMLKQGIEAALKKVKENNDKDDKEILFHLVSRRAAHYRQRDETLQAAAGYKEAFEHASSDANKGWVLTELGDNLRRLGLYADAEKCFVEGLPNDKSNWAKDAHADLLEDMGRVPEALTIDKELFESTKKDTDNVAGLTHAYEYAATLRRAGKLAEARAVLLRATAPDAVIPQSGRAACLFHLAFLCKWEILSPGTPPGQIPVLEAEMKKVIAEAEAANASLPEEGRPSIVWLPWLQGDLEGTIRRNQERAAKDKKPGAATPLEKASIAAVQGDNEEALTQFAVSLSFHWYPDQWTFESLERQALAKVPGVNELMVFAVAKDLDDLPLREERIAAWMEALPITKPENRRLVTDAAKSCRQRAADMRKTPLTLPDFTKDEASDKSADKSKR